LLTDARAGEDDGAGGSLAAGYASRHRQREQRPATEKNTPSALLVIPTLPRICESANVASGRAAGPPARLSIADIVT
jgi:hypothetical protein